MSDEYKKEDVLAAIKRLEQDKPEVAQVFQAMDAAYNDGVDDAIKIVEQERDSYYSKNVHNIALLRAKALHNNVIDKLKQLKNKKT